MVRLHTIVNFLAKFLKEKIFEYCLLVTPINIVNPQLWLEPIKWIMILKNFNLNYLRIPLQSLEKNLNILGYMFHCVELFPIVPYLTPRDDDWNSIEYKLYCMHS